MERRTRDEVLARLGPHVSTRRLVVIGNVLWLLALAVTMAMPALHTRGRERWPWICVAGFLLGLLGYVYLRLGRGNAAQAEPRREPPHDPGE